MRELKKRTSDKKIWDVLFFLLFACTLAFLVWKAPYGYIVNDEAFYLTIPYRLMQGDKLLVHEWHLSQLSSFLLYPLVRIYLSIAGTTDGIILAFRYIFVFFYGFVSGLYIYLRMRMLSKPGALFMSISFIAFAPFNIMALSYNSMGIMLLVLMAVTLVTADKSRWLLMLSGIMFAGSVLCCPFLAVIFVIYTLVVLIWRFRNKAAKSKLFSLRIWGFFTAGIVFLAVLFLLFAIAGTNLKSIFLALPEMMKDPEHSRPSLSETAMLYIKHVFLSRKLQLFSFGLCIGILILYRIDKKREEHKKWYLLVASGVTFVFLLLTAMRYRYINFYTMPLCILGLICYISSEKKEKELFIALFAVGWIYSFLICLSSNNFYYSLTCALATANAASAYFCGKAMEELLDKENKSISVKKCAATALAACIVLQQCVIIKDRAQLSFGNTEKDGINHIQTLTERIDDGVAKGLYFTPGDYDDYYELLEATEDIRQADGKSVLYFTWETWLYLMDSKENTGFSTWLSITYPEYSAERLLRYWELNEEKIPEVIYVNKKHDADGKIIEMLNICGYEIEERETCYVAAK